MGYRPKNIVGKKYFTNKDLLAGKCLRIYLFGLSSAPWGFTKILKPVVAFLRKNGIKFIFYLDDILIISCTKEQAELDFNIARELLEDLGFIIVHQTKCIAIPSRSMEYLGLIVDSMNLALCLPEAKVESIIDLRALAVDKIRISLYKMARILRKFRHFCFNFRPGTLS